jgi:hypothetical protein
MDLDCNYSPFVAKEDCPHDKVFLRVRGDKLELSFPSFCFAWPHNIGGSYIVYEFALHTTVAWFSLPDLYRYAVPDFVLAVRTKGVRYKFWENMGEKLFAPLYNGQTLYSDAVFEVWSTVNPGQLSFDIFVLPVSNFDKCACDLTMQVKAHTMLWVALCDNAPPLTTVYSENKLIFSKEKPCA